MKIDKKLKATAEELKEVDEFCKEDMDPDERKEENKVLFGALVILILIFAGIIAVGFFLKILLTNIMETVNDKDGILNISSNNYKIGNKVVLKDNSEWYVLKDSPEGTSTLVLISVNNINDGSIKYGDAEQYISSNYKVALLTKLSLNENELIVRLLSLNDISELSGLTVEQLLTLPSIDNKKTPEFLYSTNNITSSTNDYSNPILICQSTNLSQAKMCVGSLLDNGVIKPVIEIEKKNVKKRS